jgi:hypothetical protein
MCGITGLQSASTLKHGNLFAPLKGQRYDLIISNPPYVARAEVKAFPPEYRHEPVMAHLGGNDGFDLVRAILKAAPEVPHGGWRSGLRNWHGGATCWRRISPSCPSSGSTAKKAKARSLRLRARDLG